MKFQIGHTKAAAGAAGLAVAACGGGSDNGSTATAVATAAETEIAPQLGTVEQQKSLRIRTGVTAWDSSKAFDGLTLFCPNEADSIYLIAMNGNVVHRWDLITESEDPRGIRYAYLLDNGNLFIHMALPAGDSPTYVFKGGIMMEIGWEGEVLWEFEDTAQHHDARMLPNGNLLLLRVEEISSDLADRLQGGSVEEDDGFWADWVVETTLDGEVVWDYLFASDDHLLHHDFRRMPNGNILAISWEPKSAEEARAAGRRLDMTPEAGIWPDMVVEFEPLPPDDARIVWQWHAWDHLVQNDNEEAANYGDPAANPRRIDINGTGEAVEISEEDREMMEEVRKDLRLEVEG